MSAPWIAAFAALWAVVAVMLVVLIGVVRQALAAIERGSVRPGSAEVASTYGGAPPGTEIPHFVAEDPSGRLVSWSELLGRPRLCIFVAAGCPPCKTLVAELAGHPGDLARFSPILFTDDLNRPELASLPDAVTLLKQLDGAASSAFENRAFPQAFAVDEAGVVRGVAIPNTVADLRSLGSTLEGGDRRAQPAHWVVS
jgi:hypothetical protein